MAYIVNGLIAQFTSSVRATGFRDRPAARTSAKSIFTMMGYIMKNRQIAIGIEITGTPSTNTDIPSSHLARLGASLPMAMPATMHSPTQRVR